MAVAVVMKAEETAMAVMVAAVKDALVMVHSCPLWASCPGQ